MARAVRLDRIARRLALAVLLQLFACASPPLEERPWLEVQSAGFTIYTDLDRERALALSQDAELYRVVATKLTNATLTPRLPTHVFACGLDAARAHYARAIELAPDIPESHLMLGRTYLLPGEDPAAGIAAAERARALLPGHSAVHFTLAQLYARAGRSRAGDRLGAPEPPVVVRARERRGADAARIAAGGRADGDLELARAGSKR